MNLFDRLTANCRDVTCRVSTATLKRQMLRCLLVLLILLSSINLFVLPASATLRQHQDAPGVMHYHSQTSLKDNLGYAWQVVIYKVFKAGEPEDVHLRLIGFPGVVEFSHPRSLEILTKEGKLLSAADVYGETSPAPNVGEYNLTDALHQLGTTDQLKLFLPLSNQDRLVLKIPKAVMAEWQFLVTEVLASK